MQPRDTGVRRNGMRTIRLLAALGVALASLVLVPGTAFACSCVRLSTAEQVDNADVVVRGTIDSREGPPPAKIRSSADPVTYLLTVVETYKGQESGTVAVRSALSGASCGLENVRLGEEYVVFANSSGENGASGGLWANLCGGTAPATPALVSAVEAAVVSGPGTPAPSVVPSEVPAGQVSAGDQGPAALDEEPDGVWWPWVAGAALLGLVGAVAGWRRRAG